MARIIPVVPEKWIKPNLPSVRTYDIELITPMFGGGVVTRKNDPTFPIRPTAIRGQLQFWWRATVGAQYATRQELRVAQSAVWGDTTRASRVQVRLEVLKVDPPAVCARFERDNKDNTRYRSMPTWSAPFNNTALPYALFPFQGQLANGRRQIEIEPACCIHKATFRLTVTSHEDIDFAKQVEPALWAWVNFGGLGGRTRRGCGAIVCKPLAPKDADDLRSMWLRYIPTSLPQREWPTLATCPITQPDETPGDPIPVWSYLIGLFRHFRQGEGLGRNKGQQPNRPGRSRWPEPETLREIPALGANRQKSGHQRLHTIPADAFPRAELGLPIVFHFQGQGEPATQPPDPVLYPSGFDGSGQKRERMASPLILKPLALASGKTLPMILRLKTPELTGVDLRRGETSLKLPATTKIRDPRLASYRNPDSPLAGSPTGSAIEAFLAFARAEGFTEVNRS